MKASKHLVTCADDQTAFVGPECFKKIRAAGDDGYQPPLGGPRLYLIEVKSNRAALLDESSKRYESEWGKIRRREG